MPAHRPSVTAPVPDWGLQVSGAVGSQVHTSAPVRNTHNRHTATPLPGSDLHTSTNTASRQVGSTREPPVLNRSDPSTLPTRDPWESQAVAIGGRDPRQFAHLKAGHQGSREPCQQLNLC